MAHCDSIRLALDAARAARNTAQLEYQQATTTAAQAMSALMTWESVVVDLMSQLQMCQMMGGDCSAIQLALDAAVVTRDLAQATYTQAAANAAQKMISLMTWNSTVTCLEMQLQMCEMQHNMPPGP